jgi:hypothetical protein
LGPVFSSQPIQTLVLLALLLLVFSSLLVVHAYVV